MKLMCHAGTHHRGKRATPIGIGSGIDNLGDHAGGPSIDQRNRNGILVREVLVERADTDARALGDGVGRVPRKPVALQNVSRSFQNDLDGFRGAGLSGLFSWA